MKAPIGNSLQARLLALLLGALAVVWLGATAMTWLDAQHEIDELLDGHLAQAAALLVVQQAHTDEDDGVADAPSLHKYAPKVAFQVFHEGRLVMRSSNAGTTALSAVTQGFATVQRGEGPPWRVFGTRGVHSDVQVYVAEQTDSRRDILWAVMRSLLQPIALALPLLALLVWWSVRRGLMPLRTLSELLRQRKPQQLDPLPLEGLPREIHPLVESLNGLLTRIEHMMSAERRFTADAAHELRTPIAAIRAQAQVAQGADGDTAQRHHALVATLEGCDRASRVVEQMLTLARLDAGPADITAKALNLCSVVRQVAADLAPAALGRDQHLELDAESACPMSGNEALMGVLARNLIDNALRYSPAGARVVISVHTQASQVVLQVQDSGPGLTEQSIAKLGQRFFRLAGQTQPGSGLGWSIVQRIATATAGRVEVRRSQLLGGLEVRVSWPRSSG